MRAAAQPAPQATRPPNVPAQNSVFVLHNGKFYANALTASVMSLQPRMFLIGLRGSIEFPVGRCDPDK